MAELLGVQCRVRKTVNMASTAGSRLLFSGVTSGIVFLAHNNNSSGHADCILAITDRNNYNTLASVTRTDSFYQAITLSDGQMTISNSGYGIGAFTAIHIA